MTRQERSGGPAAVVCETFGKTFRSGYLARGWPSVLEESSRGARQAGSPPPRPKPCEVQRAVPAVSLPSSLGKHRRSRLSSRRRNGDGRPGRTFVFYTVVGCFCTTGRPRLSATAPGTPRRDFVASAGQRGRIFERKTLSGGSLGSRVDEERSQLRELM